jgi:glycosyltransferase involved in cell wall biosynthesis
MRIISDIHGLDRVAAYGTTILTVSSRTCSGRWPRNLRLLKSALTADYLIIHFGLPEVIFFAASLFLLPFHKCRLVTLDFFVPQPKRWQRSVIGWSLRRIEKMLVYFRDTGRFETEYAIPKRSFHYIPFKVNSWELAQKAVPSDNGYIFVGGRSRRDFRTLFEAVRSLPYPVKVLTASEPEIVPHGSSLAGITPPTNVELLYNDSDPQLFVELMANSRMVVLPILRGSMVQAGIGVYLLGMALRKCVVISAGLGVSDVLENGEACIVPPGDVDALRQTIDTMWRDGDLRATYAERGYRYARRLGGEDELFRSVLRAVGADIVAAATVPDQHLT